MIIGSCSYGQAYNGIKINKKEALKHLDYFYSEGGRIIDTAYNYKSSSIIKEWLKKNPSNELKIITKIWKQEEFFKALDELGVDKVYCVLGRENNIDMREFLKDQQQAGIIEKWGMSLYLPQELTKSYFNILQIPCDPIWFDYIQVLSLYSNIYIRSYYNLWIKNGYNMDKLNRIKLYKIMENPKVDFVVGNDNIQQIKENIELFRGINE